jgi:acetyl-CoA carboxylase biotin carboxyl carrier protein
MAEKPSGPTEPFDWKQLHYLVRLMKHYDLTALDLTGGPVQVRLRRGSSDAGASPTIATNPHAMGPVPAQLPASAFPSQPPPTEAPPASKTVAIESPMVGTYYTSSSPDAPPFVTNGSVVNPKTIVGVIEAMKVFTEIPAYVSGTIVEILVKNGQPVEFGQPLFRVTPA